MKLRKINIQDAFAQWEYTTALPADENGLPNPYHGVPYDEYIGTVLPKLISYEHSADMPDWFVEADCRNSSCVMKKYKHITRSKKG